jgi:hypothetical protein
VNTRSLKQVSDLLLKEVQRRRIEALSRKIQRDIKLSDGYELSWLYQPQLGLSEVHYYTTLRNTPDRKNLTAAIVKWGELMTTRNLISVYRPPASSNFYYCAARSEQVLSPTCDVSRVVRTVEELVMARQASFADRS